MAWTRRRRADDLPHVRALDVADAEAVAGSHVAWTPRRSPFPTRRDVSMA